MDVVVVMGEGIITILHLVVEVVEEVRKSLAAPEVLAIEVNLEEVQE